MEQDSIDIYEDEIYRLQNARSKAEAECNHWKRLFNRLEASISHHYKNKSTHFSDEVDDALYAARDRIIRDAAKGVQ